MLISCNEKNSKKQKPVSVSEIDIIKDSTRKKIIELPKKQIKIENNSNNDCEILLKEYTNFKDDFVNFMYNMNELDQDNMSEQLLMNYLNQVSEWDEKIKTCLSDPKYSSRFKEIQEEIENTNQ